MATPTSKSQDYSLADIMKAIEGLKASGALQLGQLPGMDLLSLGDGNVLERIRALQNITTPASRGVSGGELGFAPQGTIFTGGSPHQIDFTGRRLQNMAFLISQLGELFKKSGGGGKS